MPDLSLKHSRAALEAELKAAGAVIHGSVVKCPFHQDDKPSGSIFQKTRKDGTWAFHCHGCGFRGDIFDIQIRRTGVSPFQKAAPKKTRGFTRERIIEFQRENGWKPTLFEYTATGQPRMLVVRCEKPGRKTFFMYRPRSQLWVPGAPEKPWPLFEHDELQKRQQVVVIEGEKPATMLRDYLPEGFAVTTSPGGSGAAENADWASLVDKPVYFWPDNDEAGLNYMRTVCRILKAKSHAAGMFLIEPGPLNLPDGGDVVDLLDRYEEIERHKAIENILKTARKVT